MNRFKRAAWLATARPPGCAPASTNRPSCDGRHIRFSSLRLTFVHGLQKEDAMVADWIVIYAVLFVLAAAVVGRVPAET